MRDSDVETATRRLIAALDGLEAAVNRRLDGDRNATMLAAQVQSLGLDRARLAAELDASVARERNLDRRSHDVARRIDVAMENVRAVLDRHEALDPGSRVSADAQAARR